MSVSLLRCYSLIEENALSQELYMILSKKAKHIDVVRYLENRSLEHAQLVEELRETLSYNYSIENYSSKLNKFLIKRKYRKCIAKAYLNPTDIKLMSMAEFLLVNDINSYARLIKKSGIKGNLSKQLLSHHELLRNVLEELFNFNVEENRIVA